LNGSDDPEGVQNIHRLALNTPSDLLFDRQICVTQPTGMKNLAPKNMWEKTMTTLEEANSSALQQSQKPTPSNMKAKIVEYSFWLFKEGYAESTIISRTKLLKILVKRGANLFDPESIKETIAKQKSWSDGRKANAVDAYTSFLIMTDGKWDPPRYKRIRKLPFIPTEAEVDQLIAGCGPKTATLLQLLKETGMRIGEAWRLKWTELDMVNNTVRVTPEKGSNPRMFKLSGKLMAMLDAVQRRTKNSRVFCKSLKSKRRSFEKQRRTLARKLKNPRIREITFHTLRHFKATMEYHKTKDILHVMKMLGHKNIKNTLIYTQLVDFQDDDYVSRVAKTVEEACQLVEAGFEYVCEMDDVKIFRRRK
jgi:integrase